MTKSNSKIIPLGDRVLIRPYTESELKGKKKSVILLPESEGKERSSIGEVLALGKKVEGIKVGEKVVFSKYSYDEVEQGDETLYLLKQENIFAIIK